MPTEPTYGFVCPACQIKYRLRPELASRKVKCKCGHVLTAPPMPGASASQPVDRARVREVVAELLGDHDSPLDAVADADRSAEVASTPQPRANNGDGDTWKWWYYVVIGVLVGAFSIYQIIDGEPIIRFGGRRGGPVGGLILAVLCILVGVWSRPSRSE
jgi:hypothetical protein